MKYQFKIMEEVKPQPFIIKTAIKATSFLRKQNAVLRKSVFESIQYTSMTQCLMQTDIKMCEFYDSKYSLVIIQIDQK